VKHEHITNAKRRKVMNWKGILVGMVACAFLVTPAFAGEQPEFDTVGCDVDNYFNDRVKQMVIERNITRDGRVLNFWSVFPGMEGFYQTAGQEYPDPCFPEYYSHLVDAWNSAEFEWRIVLQKKPDTDLDINIRDCVLKMNSWDPFGDEPFQGASQTGRYVMPWGQVFWVKEANPRITVQAYPGEFATDGFIGPLYVDARTTPGLEVVPLVDQLYTSKGIWEESIVVVMPETGMVNKMGQKMYRLKQGDWLKISIAVPGENTANIFYGPDNVVVKYVGVHGTEYTGLECQLVPANGV
jgi:hypothetical protein